MAGSRGQWLEFSVATDREAAEAVIELFNRYSSGGAVVETRVDCFDYELNSGAGPSQVVIKTYLPLDGHVEATRRRLEEGLWHLAQIHPIPRAQVQELEDDWLDSWKRHYHRLRIGRRIVIVPEWEEYTPTPGEIVIRLEPGMAFGTGLHPTTQLCLQAIEAHLSDAGSPGKVRHLVGIDTPVRYWKRVAPTVLDVGTGSGILAIAAAKLGAASVLALDADPVAVAVAAENVSRNDVSAQVAVRHATLNGGTADEWLPYRFASETPLESLEKGCFDLVVINILAPVIMNLAPALARRTAPKGRVIAGGLITDQEPDVIRALDAHGLDVVERTQESDWVCVVAQPRAQGRRQHRTGEQRVGL